MPYAESVGHYFKTSKKAPDTWIDEAKGLIQSIGGKIAASALVEKQGKEVG